MGKYFRHDKETRAKIDAVLKESYSTEGCASVKRKLLDIEIPLSDSYIRHRAFKLELVETYEGMSRVRHPDGTTFSLIEYANAIRGMVRIIEMFPHEIPAMCSQIRKTLARMEQQRKV